MRHSKFAARDGMKDVCRMPLLRSGRRVTVAGSVRAAGFTLLEILVATAVLGSAVAALLGLLSTSLGNVQKLDSPSQALLLGQSRMNELLAEGMDATGISAGGTSIDRKFDGRWNDRFRWEAMETRFNPPPETLPGQPILVRVALDVFWQSGPGKPEKKLSLETVQLRREPVR